MIYAPHVLSKPESPDLAAARARIDELEKCLSDTAKELRESADDALANARIAKAALDRAAELEDWQRRAVGPVAYARARDPKGALGDICDQLIKEATR